MLKDHIMTLFFEERSMAVGDGVCQISSHCDRGSYVLLAVPKMDLHGYILEPEAPGICQHYHFPPDAAVTSADGLGIVLNQEGLNISPGDHFGF